MPAQALRNFDLKLEVLQLFFSHCEPKNTFVCFIIRIKIITLMCLFNSFQG